MERYLTPQERMVQEELREALTLLYNAFLDFVAFLLAMLAAGASVVRAAIYLISRTLMLLVWSCTLIVFLLIRAQRWLMSKKKGL